LLIALPDPEIFSVYPRLLLFDENPVPDLLLHCEDFSPEWIALFDLM